MTKQLESPKYDPNNPFQQTWQDLKVDENNANKAENIETAKRFNAHTYLSTKVDLSNLHKTFGKTASIEYFLRKAI